MKYQHGTKYKIVEDLLVDVGTLVEKIFHQIFARIDDSQVQPRTTMLVRSVCRRNKLSERSRGAEMHGSRTDINLAGQQELLDL